MLDLPETTASAVLVLLLSAQPADRDELASILRNTRWHVILAETASSAFHMLRAVEFPVVLWDRDVQGMEWRQALRELANSRCRPAALLLSDVDDSYLWEEVVHAGGFDVLTRPFRGRDVMSSVEFAYRHWEASRRELRSA
jgi:DNA-binding response OmpR family regulator